VTHEPDPPPPLGAAPALLEAALAALPVAAIVSEADRGNTRIVLVNRRFEDLLGWPADELLGRDASALYVGPIGLGEMQSTLSAAGELLHYESQARMKDGGLRHIKNSTSVFDHEGRTYAISTSVAVDADELEDALHESEARLQAILDAVPFLFAVIEPDGRFRMANRPLCRQLGRAPEDVLGHKLEDVFTPESAAAMRGYLRRMADGADLEVRESAFDGGNRELCFRTSCFPLRGSYGPSAGRPYAACLLAIDVTDERATEAALRESDTRFRQLAGSIDDAFILWGGDPPQVLYSSPSLPRLYGVSDVAEIPTDENLSDRSTHPDDEAFRWEMYNKRRYSDEDFDYEYRIIHPDGQVRWIRVHSSRVRVDGVPVDRVATMMSDVTERKQSELELRAAWATAEEANQRKNDFLSRMSHELRTPLNAILGFTQLLELDELTGEQRSNLSHVGAAGRHLLELIDDVLDVSRIESGELRLSIGTVDLADAIGETVAMLRPQMSQSDVTLDVPLDAPSVTVIADRQRLVQVLLNLLTNAVKFNRPGGRARLRWMALPNARVRIQVDDTGIGMSPADVERLFTPFERFAPDVQGTGIGLVLSRQLVEAMDGTLAVASTLDEGTTVTVELPGAAPAEGEPVGVRSHRGQVLHLGTNPSDVELLRRTLELLPGCELVLASTPSDALRAVTERTPDLLLVDVGPPDQSVEDLVRRLRSRPETTHVEVLVISAEVPLARRLALEELGVARFLSKPYRLSQLLDAVEASIEP